MPPASTVKLNRAETPIFGARCLVCHGTHNINGVELTMFRRPWWSGMPFFWDKYKVKVPVCVACQPTFTKQRWIRRVVLLGVLGVGLGGAFYLAGGYEGPFRKYLLMAVAMVIVSPYLVWETIWPPFISVTLHTDEVEYEFKSPEYALEFASLNSVTVS